MPGNDPKYTAAPQKFTYAGRVLEGQLLSFSGQSRRRFVDHEYPKRASARVEDMARAPRRLEVRLTFLQEYDSSGNITQLPAQAYRNFEQFIDQNPTGTIIHPVFGAFNAFCDGPTHQVDFSRSVTEITVSVSWHETISDRPLPTDIESLQIALQSGSVQLSQYEQATARYMGDFVQAQTFSARALNAIEDALAQVSLITDPMDFMLTTIGVLPGMAGSVIGTVEGIALRGSQFSATVNNYLEASSNSSVFSGTEIVPGSATQTSSLLGTVQLSGGLYEAFLLSTQVTPAGAADAVGAAEDTVSACLVIEEAAQASRPPLIVYTVPFLTDVVTMCQRLYKKDALARASEILGLNRILNPAAIPAGTNILRPAR